MWPYFALAFVVIVVGLYKLVDWLCYPFGRVTFDEDDEKSGAPEGAWPKE